jgi:hypothetical protein
MKHSLKCIDTQYYLDDKLLDPRESQKYHNHSPDGFNHGYGGSGPSQLALAIILKITGDAGKYQDFKWDVIATIPGGKDFDITFEYDIVNKTQKILFING